ncbi:MAG: ArsR family transcriptional regulator [Candidatus Thorarchaeota archaeon]|nr:MAG: ArsR family transcriptional regulator [Candidatus Thorarchaeota archaeon]
MGNDLMTKPKILVALLGEPTTIERIVIRRRIDELFLVFSDVEHEFALPLIEKFSTLGMQVIPIHIQSLKFSNILSSILRALNHQTLDDYDVEFNVDSGNPVMILAACIAAAILGASVLCTEGNNVVEISELWPAKLVNITYKKRQILNFLENFNDSINQKDISGEIGICQSSISRHIRDLEIAGYVTRTRVAKKKVVKISELGSTILHHKQLRKRRIWASYSIEPPTGIQTAS